MNVETARPLIQDPNLARCLVLVERYFAADTSSEERARCLAEALERLEDVPGASN